jgi:hypothetical protein
MQQGKTDVDEKKAPAASPQADFATKPLWRIDSMGMVNTAKETNEDALIRRAKERRPARVKEVVDTLRYIQEKHA